ncbi:unnamed protein product, partial [Symbiodinium necroappetens]
VSKQRFDEMEEKGRETTKRLEMAREELHGLRAEDGESPVRSTVEDAKAILAQKTAKLNQQTLQVEKLEKELQDNREQLEKQSLRMAEVHAEATEFEMKSKCLDERKLQLQQDLEDKPGAEKPNLIGSGMFKGLRRTPQMLQLRRLLLHLHLIRLIRPSRVTGVEQRKNHEHHVNALASADPGAKSSRRSAKDSIARSVRQAGLADHEDKIQVVHLSAVLAALEIPEQHVQTLAAASGAIKEDGIHLSSFLEWIFPEEDSEPPPPPPPVAAEAKGLEMERGSGSMLEQLYSGSLTLEDTWVQASFMLQLDELLRAHPYLEPDQNAATVHPLQYWVTRCRESFVKKKFGDAQDSLRRLLASLRTDQRQIAEAFRRFDADSSGHLDANECKNMCAYLGWGLEEASLMDLDKDGRITLADFQGFVGRMGGVQQLFEHRRLRISSSRK